MRKNYAPKWLLVFIILHIATWDHYITAQDSITQWSLEIASHYSGLKDYYQKVAEFDRGKEGLIPEILLNFSHTKLYYAQGCAIAGGMPPLSIIPTAYLRPANPEAGVTGLTATYYDNPAFEGEPALTQVDPLIDFIWKDTTPLTGQWAEHFAVRWTGYLTPPVSGRYKLGASGFSSYRLYLDDKDVSAKALISEDGLEFTPEAPLQDGRHTVRIEIRDKAGNSANRIKQEFCSG